MKKIALLLLALSFTLRADTPGTAKANVHSGDGITSVTATTVTGKNGLDVNIIGGSGSPTVTISPIPLPVAQSSPAPAASAWPVYMPSPIPSQTVVVSNFPVPSPTITVAGTVTANVGTTGGLALDSTVSSLSSKFGSLGQKTMSGSAPVVIASDQSAIPVTGTVITSPNVNVHDASGTNINSTSNALNEFITNASLAVSQFGTWSVGRTWALTSADVATVVQPTGTNLHTVVDSGSITANAGTNLNTSALATSALQTSGAQKTQIVDGSGSVVGPIQTISGTNYAPVVVAASATSGSALVARSIQVAGSDGTNARNISTDTSGNVNVNIKSELQDSVPASQNVTTQDLASTSTPQANGQNVITGTPTVNSAANFTISSAQSVEVGVTGTWTGTLQSEISFDGGLTWFTRGLKQAGSAYLSSSYTQNFQGGADITGTTNYRVRATGAITGTAIVKIVASDNAASIVVTNPLTLRDSVTQSVSDTIKAASTLPLSTDTALVVTNRDTITTNAAVAPTQSFSLAALNAAQTYDVRQLSVVNVTITSVGSGFLFFQATVDGSNWATLYGYPVLGGQAIANPNLTGTYGVNVAGYQTLRMVLIAYTSGTYAGSIYGVQGAGPIYPSSQQAAASSQSVTLSNENVQDLYMAGAPAQTATVNNILPGGSTSNATDLTGYRYGSVQVVSTGTGGTFIFEGSNDNVNFQTMLVANQSLITGSINAVAITASSSSNVYQFPITTRYMRLRIATTITGGSIQAFSKFSQNQWSPMSIPVSQNTAADLATTATIAANQFISVPVPSQSTDVASAAITTTTTTATVVPGFGNSYNSTIDVTVVAGTNPTMDVVIQESSDLGTNWYSVYEFPLITATGSYTSPILSLTGSRLRYVQTITGSAGQSFTRSVTRNQITSTSPTYREIIDRTINPTSTNSTTPVLQTNGASNLQMIVNQGSGGSAVTFALDGSDDNSNWVNGIATVIGVVGGATPVSVIGPNNSYKFIRGRVVTGIASTTISYLSLIASGVTVQPTTTQVSGTTGLLIDGSGTTSGTPSTSTQVFAANPTRKYLLIQNIDTTTEWINFTGAATAGSGSIQLLPGAAFVEEANAISTEAINILSTGASVKFTAKQQ